MSKANIGALVSFFPMERCRELVKLTLADRRAKFLAKDPVIMAPLNSEDRKEIDKLKLSKKAKKELDELVSFLAGKRVSELPQLTTEEVAEDIEEKTLEVATCFVASWLNVLHHSRRPRSGDKDKPVRLDSSLLPPLGLTSYAGVGLYEFMANSSRVLSVKQTRELMSFFAANLIPAFNKALAVYPEGIQLTVEGLTICRDADGFYLPPKDKK